MDLQTAFVPARAKPVIQKKLASRAWRDDWYQEDDDVPATEGQLEAELEELLEIQRTANACFNDEASECSWNIQVHYPPLRQATKWGSRSQVSQLQRRISRRNGRLFKLTACLQRLQLFS
ncbi:hypothetical protein M0657_011786 [Pyricularia oryzae]|nr:hypothetical protein M0657_011786 [Pyricularia oryzae]KAI7916081.1 hypothetical protein M9X92_008044 [Pyricularia oryzae]